ncbi:MAG: AAA family ATPase [Syntrophaceae bacterium]|nr:AAA family ATPase [Syntrophaceae bacterium]
MRKIACQNLKGGTGKTTTVISLASCLAGKGKKVLVLDVDVQGNIKVSFGIDHKLTMYDLLINDAFVEDCIVKTRDNIDCIISNNTLASCELQLSGMHRREEILRIRMKHIDQAARYDFVLIDCSPSLSLLNQNALLYADEVIIPISMDYLAMLGATQVIDNLVMIKKYYEKQLIITGVIPTFYEKRTNMSQEVMEALQDTYKEKVFPAVRLDTKIKQASSANQTIFEVDKQSRGAEDYNQICEVLLDEKKSIKEYTKTG